MLYSINNEILSVTVNSLGAELFSIKKNGTEYLWGGDERYWRDRALNIFPYVARLWGGEYTVNGEKYRMNIHGIAPYAEFSAEKPSSEKLVFTLCSDEETKKQYPFDFTFRIIYTLLKNVLHITYEITNDGKKTMYFGLGGHPGFNVPLSDGLLFEDYKLVFDKKSTPKRVVFTPDCFVTGEMTDFPLKNGDTLPLSHSLFDDDAIVLTDVSSKVTLLSEKSGKYVSVSYPEMKYLGIWHMPKTDAPYVCIEPWCSLPSADGAVTEFTKKDDLISLSPCAVYENDWLIEIG